MAKPKIVIFLSSVRPGRMNDRVGKLVRNAVEARGMEPVIFDPAEMPFELVKTPMHFMANPDEEAPAWMKEANENIKYADGFIVVSAEYNYGVPPALSNMLDHFAPSSFRHRPCAIVTYSMGVYGGVRALSSVLAMVYELGMIPIPTNLPVPVVHESVSPEGDCKVQKVNNILAKLVNELSWYTRAIQTFKKQEPTPANVVYY